MPSKSHEVQKNYWNSEALLPVPVGGRSGKVCRPSGKRDHDEREGEQTNGCKGVIAMRRWLWLGLGLCGWMAVSSAALAEEWTKTFNISGQAELRVETSDARIQVDTWDEKKIEARVTSNKWGFGQGGINVIDHQTGDSVEIEVRFPHGIHIMSIGDRRTVIEIHMPREGKVRLHTGDGEIRLRDLKGSMELESGDGGLEVEGVEGVLRAHSGDGHVRARGRFDNLDI